MKKCWKVIGSIVLVVFVLGLICVGVGILTGAESTRILNVLDDRFQIESTLNLYSQYFAQFGQAVGEIFR